MSDDAKPVSKPTHPRANDRRRLRYAVYLLGGLTLMLTIAYIDGGEEPLHPIVQSVTMNAQPEGRL